MNIKINGGRDNCDLALEGAMTHRHSRYIEDTIIDSMRRYPHLNVDLSGVSEIDLCGIHLLGVLRSFGDNTVRIVAASPLVEAALAKLPASPHITGRSKHQRVRAHSPRAV